MVDVPDVEKKYDIDSQANDLLDDLLANIPNVNRTDKVVNNIHTMIERYKQLRKFFSVYDDNNNIIGSKKRGYKYKPLLNELKRLNKKIYWILPVSVINKKLYFKSDDSVEEYYDDTKLYTPFKDTYPSVNILTGDKEHEMNDKLIPETANSYNYKVKLIDNFTKPFEKINNDNNDNNYNYHVLKVKNNLTSVVDNNDNMETNVLYGKNDEMLRNKRFYLQNYTLGASKLKNVNNVINRLNIVPNEKMNIKSMLFLPQEVIEFSHINLPKTNIMERVNLNKNFISYWRFLNNRTNVKTNNININKNMVHDKNFFKNIQEFKTDDNLTSDQNYNKFLNTIIPDTQTIFNLIKDDIKHGYSINNVMFKLEPYMIYKEDLSYKQFQEMNLFIKNKIKNYNEKYIKNVKEYQKMNELNLVNNKYMELLINIISDYNTDLKNKILNLYNIDENNKTNSEIYKLLLEKDNSIVYNSIVSKLNIDLLFFDNNTNILELNEFNNNLLETKNDESKDDESKDDDCNNIKISKIYKSKEKLEDDNNKIIYYDDKLDDIYYELLEVYEDGLIIENSVDRIDNLISKIMTNNGLNEDNARIYALSLIDGKRKVLEKDYAILDINNTKDYYIRFNNTWILKPEINYNDDDLNNYLCNSKPKCLIYKDKCNTIDNIKYKINEINTNEIINQYDKKIQDNIDNFKKFIDNKLIISINRLNNLNNIEYLNSIKYNIDKYKLGINNDYVIDKIKSPYEKLKNAILGQGYFVKRQNDLIKFIDNYTRPSNSKLNEDTNWLYCIESNAKLLPSYMKELSLSYMNNDQYELKLDQICAERGTISDDGESWVDKHSGYVIRRISFNIDEGYTEEGFKITSRDILEEDIGSILIKKKDIKVKDQNSYKISNVMNALLRYMKININDSDKEYVINSVKIFLNNNISNKSEYEKKRKRLLSKGKKIDEYNIVNNSLLIISTISLLFIIIQTSVPSIKNSYSFPGCKASFKGFPLYSKDKYTGLNYIICVSKKIADDIDPWNGIYKLSKKKLLKNIINNIENYVINDSYIISRIDIKKRFLRDNKKINNNDDEFSICNWINFSPPLIDFNIKNVVNISKNAIDNFYKEDLVNGDKNQFKFISLIKSSIINYSLGIVNIINNIVKDKFLILSKNSGELYLENACCDDGNYNPFIYFSNINSDIVEYNKNVNKLNNILNDIENLTNAPILFDKSDTRVKFPELLEQFTEETIYRTFISYCKYDTERPINDKLLRICSVKPNDYNINDDITKKIQTLKNNGINYSIEDFNKLLNIVNNSNVVDIDLNIETINDMDIIKNILLDIKTNNDTYIKEEFVDKFLLSIENKDNIRDFKNYLDENNKIMKDELFDFINSDSNVTKLKFKNFKDCILEFERFDYFKETMYNEKTDNSINKMIEYVKNSLYNIISVFPNFVINNLDYSDINVPKHWKLSNRHNNDIKKFIKKYYTGLQELTNDNQTNIIMEYIMKNNNILKLVNRTIYISPIKMGDNIYYKNSIFDRRLIFLLFKYYYLLILTNIMNLKDNTTIIQQPIIQQMESKSEENIETYNQGEISELDIVMGNQLEVSQKISKILIVFIQNVCADKNIIYSDYSSIQDKVFKLKEQEKYLITEFLGNLSNEEREIENIFKNNKLEKWGKGLQKGLVSYNTKTYEQEIQDMEKNAIIRFELDKNSLVNDMNRDIYEFDYIENKLREQDIEHEVNDLSNYSNEDFDYGDNEFTDEHFFSFESF